MCLVHVDLYQLRECETRGLARTLLSSGKVEDLSFLPPRRVSCSVLSQRLCTASHPKKVQQRVAGLAGLCLGQTSPTLVDFS